MIHISTLFLMFMLYSILGWLFETVYCSLVHFSWDNRGMLNGPYCPIYGVGAVLAMQFCGTIESPALIFVICAFGSAILEYSTSWLTEKLFHVVWWDYSYLPLNLNGRICLSVSLGFGLAGIVVTQLIGPRVIRLISLIPFSVQEPLALILMAIFAADLALTLDALVSLNQKLSMLEDNINNSIAEHYDPIAANTREKMVNGLSNVKEKLSPEESRESFTTEALKRFLPLLNPPQKHIIRSFKGFRKVRYKDLGQKLKQTISKKKDTFS